MTATELFFDLVYVFAVTQLSHLLLGHLTPRGALETAVLLAAVWWAWNYTAWATNWIDPDRPPVRALLIGLMLLSLIMSAAIPEAFDGRGLQFAGAFVAMGLVRGAFMVYALRGSRMGRNYAQLTAWTAIAGAVWIVGALLDGDARLATWLLALALDYAAPLHGFQLPGAGRTPTADWTLAGGHLAERGQLVVLIALGESLLAAGKTFSDLETEPAVVFAFVSGFFMSVSLWSAYFIRSAQEGARVISQATDPTRVARSAYAYAHGLMVGGIIVAAVGIDLAIEHPGGQTATSTAATILGGPGLYLLGSALFNWSLTGIPPTSRLAGVAVLALLSPVALVAGPAALLCMAAVVVLVLALATGRPH
ncbi:low temperature requirement protein A [Candidatus Solirubrobacter pratensis]|uniref:low temperature requirement protein A n=1 Tax=Candidatus Solirubrobacter pratensis TaxID=1298857 RepID=UPI00040FEA49|nr:low temperature requirement protein A [Candidatus Solirubrobacter pratensis]